MKQIHFFKSFFLGFALLPMCCAAGVVSPRMAQQVAEHQLNASSTQTTTIRKAPRQAVQVSKTDDWPFYLFNAIDGSGYVIVAGDDVAHPVLGYSDSGTLDMSNMPDNMRAWLDEYARQIRWAQENDIQQDDATAQEWTAYLSGAQKAATVVVGPLLTTTWSQSPYYNDLCPYDKTLSDRNYHATTGCVATAMAQVMKYWEYPTKGIGSHSYTPNSHPSYGTLTANFGATTYNWSNMPNELTKSSSAVEKSAVATLMYHCGVSVDMDYNNDNKGSSGAFTNSVPNALKNYFGYDSAAFATYYLIFQKLEYYLPFPADAIWMLIIQNQLDNKFPVVMSGNTLDGSGHAFVCDGYDTSKGFHFNWGWGSDGQSKNNNGYFPMFALSTNSGDFSSYQTAVVDIQKPRPESYYDLQLMIPTLLSSTINIVEDLGSIDSIGKDLAISAVWGDSIYIYPNIINVGNKAYTGNLYAYFISFTREGDTYLGKKEDSVLLAKDITIAAQDLFNTPVQVVIPSLPQGDYFVLIETENEKAEIGTDYVGCNISTTLSVDKPFEEGKYMVVGFRNYDDDTSEYFFMTSDLGTAKNKRYQAVIFDADLFDQSALQAIVDAKSDKDKYIWEVEKSGGGWKLKNGSQYSDWSSGNTAILSNKGRDLTIIGNWVSGIYGGIISFDDETTTRILSLNKTKGNNYFAYYIGTNQLSQLMFVPYKEGTPEPDTSSKYVILAKRSSGNYYYMTSDLGTASSKRFQAVDAGTSEHSKINTAPTDASYIWEIETVTGGVALKNGTQYATWKSGNTANLSTTPLILTQEISGEQGTFSFVDSDNNTRSLALNNTVGNNYFAFYKGTQVSNLLVLPYGSDISTNLENTLGSEIHIVGGVVECESAFRIYDMLGRDVTANNGNLHGLYIIVTADETRKVEL